MAFLEVQNLSKSYVRMGKPFMAVDRVSLTMEKGEFVELIGRSGSGKSTLLHLIAGLLEADTGSVTLDGEEIQRAGEVESENAAFSEEKGLREHRRSSLADPLRVSYLAQSFKLLPNLNVWDNIRMPYALLSPEKKASLDETALREQSKELLAHCRLEPLLELYPAALSGGESRRVLLARSLFLRPQLLLADEALSDLDAKSRDEMIELLHAYHRDGLGILMVTHELDRLRAPRVFTMEDGTLLKGQKLR